MHIIKAELKQRITGQAVNDDEMFVVKYANGQILTISQCNEIPKKIAWQGIENIAWSNADSLGDLHREEIPPEETAEYWEKF